MGLEVPLRRVLGDVGVFSRALLPGFGLRPYQVGPARAIVEAVAAGGGRQLAIVFSRQAGKDELLAQTLAFLLARYQARGGSIVLGAPTFKPQAALSRDRLLDRLGNPLTARSVRVRDGYTVAVGRATASFLSAGKQANARGQTASLLLVANEAQDIDPGIWDARFDPMAASTNATTLFLGTVWSGETLLARQLRHLEELERADGIRRVWRVAWEEVARDLPAYGERVRARMAQLGAGHPFIRTEYCLEELDGAGGLFPEARLALLRGEHPRRHAAEAGKRYALLIDVAGEEEEADAGGPLGFAGASEGRRDSTVVTVVEVDVGDGSWGMGDGTKVTGDGDGPSPPSPHPEGPARRAGAGEITGLPVYRVVDRLAWTGTRHTALHATIVRLARSVWRASAVVPDATGVGAGLASFLAASLGDRRGGRTIPVIPFVFTAASKSQLGWDLLGLIDSGRLREYADDSGSGTPEGRLTAELWAQLRATTYETRPGPGRLLRWGVPAGRGHDDLVMSLALTAALEGVDWRSRVARGSAEC